MVPIWNAGDINLLLMALQPFCFSLGSSFSIIVLYTVGRTSGTGASAGCNGSFYIEGKQNNRTYNICASSGIRNHEPNIRVLDSAAHVLCKDVK
jgi:hypothetical protein